jgi:hypothetical protein
MALGWAIALLSFSVLANEVLLTRWLSISLWHHMAFLIISLALLGFGASGTFLSLWGRHHRGKVELSFAVNAILCGMSSIASIMAIRSIPFNPLELLWDPWQLLTMALIYAVLTVPFFFAANALGIAFYGYSKRIHGLYLWDLAGAGTGALAVLVLLWALPFQQSIRVAATGAVAASALTLSLEPGRHLRAAFALVFVGLVVVWTVPSQWISPPLSPYKGLSRALLVPDARVVAERWSPLGWWTAVESPTIPFRYAPGMSSQCAREIPEQVGIFLDGEANSFLTRQYGQGRGWEYLDCLTSALPYHLLETPRVLVLEAGGVVGVMNALSHKAADIQAVESHPSLVEMICGELGWFAGPICQRQRVRWHIGDPRGYLMANPGPFDLIDIYIGGSPVASFSGARAFSEDYMNTVEALELYLERLDEGGIISMTTWLQIPPRGSLRMAATAIEAVRRRSLGEPARMIAIIRGLNTVTMLVKRGEFTHGEVEEIRAFCGRRGMDVVYLPGIGPEEVNRRNILTRPFLYEGVSELLGGNARRFLENYTYRVEPVSDDRPFFSHFMRWSNLGRFLSMRHRGGVALMDWSFPLLLICLAEAIIISIGLIIFPLWVGRAGTGSGSGMRLSVVLYFLSIGLGFLMLEMSAVQKLHLYLGHPIYSFAVVVAAFLIFAGMGSGMSKIWERTVQRAGWLDPVVVAVAALIAVALLAGTALESFLGLWWTAGLAIRALWVSLLIAPVAFFMGMAFPLGIRRLSNLEPALIPWAWGINGCASVISPILATLLAMELGFRAVMLIALALYCVAAAAGLGLKGDPHPH